MKLMNKMILSMAMIMAVTACTKENIGNDSADSDGMVRFVAAEEITRTHFGTPDGNTCPTLWTGNESVAVALNYSATAQAEVKASVDGKSMAFSALLEDDTSGSYSFCVISPVAVFKDKSEKNKRILLAIPTEQHPTAESCDEAAQIVAAYTAPVDIFPFEVALSFRHITAYGLLSIKNLEAGAMIQSVKLTSSVEISDRIYWYPESGIVEPHSSKASKEITLVTSSAENIWVALKPTDLSGTTMTIDVTTEKGVYTKTVTFPSGRNLVSGQIAQLSFDFSGITVGDEEEPVEPIAVGDVWKDGENAVGVVFWVSEDGQSAKIVSLERTETTVAWSTAENPAFNGAESASDGKSNTSILKASSEASLMPILSFCTSLGDGWYWPATNEFRDLFEVYNGTSYSSATVATPNKITDPEKAARESFDKILTDNGGTALNTADKGTNGDAYWSSREWDATHGGYIRFGKYYIGGKTEGSKTQTTRYGRCMKIVTR